jgi:hypothetical protein
MNTFTAQDMKDYGDYVTKTVRHHILPDFEFWYSRHFKPAKKVIDLTMLIDGIDCEFGRSNKSSDWGRIGTLINVGEYGYYSKRPMYHIFRDISDYPKCQPRMNHKHAWDSDKCPIEGFVVRAWLDKEDFVTIHTSDSIIDWNDVVYVEFLEVEHGYVMPWEVSE